MGELRTIDVPKMLVYGKKGAKTIDEKVNILLNHIEQSVVEIFPKKSEKIKKRTSQKILES